MADTEQKAITPEIMKRLIDLRDELADGLQSTHDTIASRAELPLRLYHFTDTDGMIAIIKNRSLRATLATALNDTSELKVGVREAKAVLKKRLERNETVLDVGIQFYLDPEHFNAVGRIDVRPCVVSFCPNTDLSLHWMHYGRNGTGCALGFATSRLAVDQMSLVKVRYQPETQREVIEELLRTAHKVVKKAIAPLKAKDDIHTYLNLAAHMTVSFIRAASSLFKDEAFQFEDEWRMSFQLVLNVDRPRPRRGYKFEIGYRAVNGRVCPYGDITYPKKSFPLEAIVLGRASPMSEDDGGIRVLLEDSLGPETASKIIVTRSEVPIRP